MNYVLMGLAGWIIGAITPTVSGKQWYKFCLGFVALMIAYTAGKIS